MSFTDTYTYKARITSHSRTTREQVYDFGEHIFFIPYADNSSRPSTGMIVSAGILMPLYNTTLEWMKDFNLLSRIGCKDRYYSAQTWNGELFPSIKPNFDPNYYGNANFLWAAELENGKVVGGDFGSSTLYGYANKEDFINNRNGVTLRNATNAAHFIPTDFAGGTGSTLGVSVLVYYTGVDADEIPNSFSYVNITGLLSTNSSLYINGYGNIDNAVLNFALPGNVRPVVPPPTDPYTPDPDGPDGPSEPGGGEGDRDDVDVPVPIPGLPPISAADTGFVTLFNPSSTQIKSLANYMWSSGFDIATFKNIVANPMECILGLSIIPFTPSHGASDTVKVGNIDTGLVFPTVANQFEEIDCGTVQVSEYWGSYLDYSPYTKISLYLPYIGIVPLDIDEVQGKTLAIKYHVDVLSGACIAYLLCGTSVLYSYIGQCSCNVPVTSNDFTNTVNGVLGIAGNIGSLVALGGSSAPMATGTAIKTAASMASNAINMLKPNVQKSGAMAGTGGLMGTQYPYIIKQRPRQSVPAGQNTFKGYPSNIAVKLGDLSGYTEVDEVHLDGIPATDAEMNEILQLLSEGVYL